MSEHVSINPGRFGDALTQDYYPAGLVRTRFKNQREKRVAWLGKKFANDAVARALADTLNNCGPSARCKSAACPECSRAAQNLFVGVTERFLKTHANLKNVVCVTIVPADGVVDPGQLSADQHARDLRRWKDGLGRAGDGGFIGGIDYSFNEHDAGR